MSGNHARRRSRFRFVAMACAGVLTLSACSGGSGGDRDTSEFTWGVRTAIPSLDITRNFARAHMPVMTLTTEPLQLLTEGGQIEPHLATEVNSPEPDTLVYTLRTDVTFSDGEPMTAEDVAWTLEHTFAADGGAQTATLLPSFESATATDSHEVTVQLSRPDPSAMTVIADVTLVQQAAFAQAQGDDLGTAQAPPVGTGPYVVSDYSAQGLTLDRNPDYWGEESPIETISVAVIPDETSAQLALRSGSLNGTSVQDVKGTDQWEAIDGADVVSLSDTVVEYLSFDTTGSPLDDIQVRRAFAHALDREGVMAATYGNEADLLRGFLAHETVSAAAPTEQEAQTFLDSLPTYEFDMAQAEAALSQSSHADGFELTVPYPETFTFARLAVLNLQENLRPLGIEITPESVSQGEWITQVYAHEDLGLQTMRATLGSDPVSALKSFVGAATAVPNSFNTSNYTTPSVEETLTDLTTSFDETVQWEATQQIVTDIAEDLAYLPLFSPRAVYVVGAGFAFDDAFSVSSTLNGQWYRHVVPS